MKQKSTEVKHHIKVKEGINSPVSGLTGINSTTHHPSDLSDLERK